MYLENPTEKMSPYEKIMDIHKRGKEATIGSLERMAYTDFVGETGAYVEIEFNKNMLKQKLPKGAGLNFESDLRVAEVRLANAQSRITDRKATIEGYESANETLNHQMADLEAQVARNHQDGSPSHVTTLQAFVRQTDPLKSS